MRNANSSLPRLFPGLALAAAFTVLISVIAPGLAGFDIVGKTVPFAYPWRLITPTAAARLTAWAGYLLHNLLIWLIIFLARRQQPRYADGMRWFNWSAAGINALFIVLHILQTHFFYDGLAQDVPELSALGSVALMLIVILILETPRRGLLFGKKLKFPQRFLQVIRHYHGYLFSWAAIYTFWYHPTEGTWGHLLGFFYMFMLFAQSSLLFNRAHLNKWWTFTLEAFVILHSLVVALLQGNAMWPMFAFGFGAMVVLTQMYGLGLSTWVRRALAVLFVGAAVWVYAAMGRLTALHEIIRIPVLDYAVLFLLYGIYVLVNWIAGRFSSSPVVQAALESAERIAPEEPHER